MHLLSTIRGPDDLKSRMIASINEPKRPPRRDWRNQKLR